MDYNIVIVVLGSLTFVFPIITYWKDKTILSLFVAGLLCDFFQLYLALNRINNIAIVILYGFLELGILLLILGKLKWHILLSILFLYVILISLIFNTNNSPEFSFVIVALMKIVSCIILITYLLKEAEELELSSVKGRICIGYLIFNLTTIPLSIGLPFIIKIPFLNLNSYILINSGALATKNSILSYIQWKLTKNT